MDRQDPRRFVVAMTMLTAFAFVAYACWRIALRCFEDRSKLGDR